MQRFLLFFIPLITFISLISLITLISLIINVIFLSREWQRNVITRVVDVKPQAPGRVFAVLDAGMTELLRPALYAAYHRIEPLERRAGSPITCDFVGPLCESSDVVGGGRRLASPFVGEAFAILDTGAYGFVMASNYNRRPMPAEVLVDGETWRVVRRRQTIDDVMALEM